MDHRHPLLGRRTVDVQMEQDVSRRDCRSEQVEAGAEAAGLPEAPAGAGADNSVHANRMLRSSHREHELVIYDFLERLYESQAARLRNRTIPA